MRREWQASLRDQFCRDTLQKIIVEAIAMLKKTLALALVPIALGAQEHAHQPPEKLGTVHFATSCNAEASREFDRAVALLHSFEFGDAIKGFSQALAADSTCAMGYWGIALSRWGNPMAAGNRTASQISAGLDAINSARRTASAATPRERAYIESAARLFEQSSRASQLSRVSAYETAMRELAHAHPEDTEAQIFYALSIVAAAPPTDKSYAHQEMAAAILEPLWRVMPDHPGLAHYLIHTFDYPALAKQGSAAAREYALIAPSTAHAMHMPSHIFTRTGMWTESIATNLKSMEIAEKTGSIAETLHAADYAEYAYLQLGCTEDARRILQKLPSLASRFDVNAVTGAAPGSAGVYALAAIPARFALEREAWAEAASLTPAGSDFPWTEAVTWFARGIGAARMRDARAASLAADSLTSIRQRLAAKEVYWSEQVAIQELAVQAWAEFAKGNRNSAESLMRKAVSREAATEKSAVTPGPIAPARELLADMLMAMGRKQEALVEYRLTLEVEPQRRRSLEGVRLAQR